MSSLKKSISIISFLLLSATMFADKLLSDSSKLVVIITVEDMNQELIDKYFNEFDGGFKRLASGTYYPNVEFQYLPTDYATDIATLFSGTNPNFHGIIGSKRFFSKELKYIHSLTDPDAKGLNDDWHLSGKPLLSTTYADRLSEDRLGLPRIVSVATDPTIAMLMAGHSGLPIYMNNLTGEWSTSSYYADAMPKWLEEYNAEKPIDQYLDRNWENIYPAAYYVSASSVGGTGFSYNVRGACNGLKMFQNFTTIPYCNDYICDVALKAIEKEKMGNDMTTDLLMVNFSLSRFYLKQEAKTSLELEDSYLRLDKTLKRLLENIENKVGKENLTVVLTGSRTYMRNVTQATNKRIEYNAFNADKYSALLNSYLMAFYGQKKWVLSCKNGNIYLNREEIEKAGLKLTDVQKKAMEFFYLIPGLQNVCTSAQMEEAFYTTGVLHYAYYRDLSGDLLYCLMPRWYETDLNDTPTGFFSSYTNSVSMYIYGGKNRTPETKDTVIKATFLGER